MNMKTVPTTAASKKKSKARRGFPDIPETTEASAPAVAVADTAVAVEDEDSLPGVTQATSGDAGVAVDTDTNATDAADEVGADESGENEADGSDEEGEVVANDPPVGDELVRQLREVEARIPERVKEEQRRIHVVDPDGRDVILLHNPAKCLRCSYLVGDIRISGEDTEPFDECHHEYGVDREGNQVGNPNCPAANIRMVRGVNFDSASRKLADALDAQDLGALAKITAKLEKLDPSVSKKVFQLAEELRQQG